MNDNPKTICPLCKHADRGATAWPCRGCLRINQMEDRFEPNDEFAEKRPLTLTETDELAKRLFEKFSVNCGNCPATVYCVARYEEQPEAGDKNCLDAFAFWLKQDTNVRKGNDNA